MIHAYCLRDGTLDRIPVAAGDRIPADAVWIDILRPSNGEDHLVEDALGIAVPTREEMVEIEPSSRLRIESGAAYMTGSIVCNSESEQPMLSEVTFILVGGKLATVRYDESKPFSLIIAKLDRGCPADMTGEQLMLELLDTIIDRAADIIERLAVEIDGVSRRVFEKDEAAGGTNGNSSQRYRVILRMIGRKGDLGSKVRESLVSIQRLLTFLVADVDSHFSKDQRAALKSMQRDVGSLNDHVSFLGNKVTFLLDATLGMVSIEQNNIIKIFAVLSVVLMPPTLIASIYGMNFQHMPELDVAWGYPTALVAMLIAAVVPYMIFKWKRWL